MTIKFKNDLLAKSSISTNKLPNLYVFGDSFSVPSQAISKSDWVDWQWTVQLSERMNMTLNSMGEFGVSNEWIILKCNNFVKEFKPGDHIIVQTTEAGRYWYFKDKHWFGNPFGLHDDLVGEGYLSKGEADALKGYITYIHTDEKEALRQQSHYAYLNTIRWKLSHEDIHMHILPGFDQPTQFPIAVTKGPVIGCLQVVSSNEFIDRKRAEEWYGQTDVPDQRLNHLSKDNHSLLAERLYNHITKGTELDFTKGWLGSYLSIDTIRQDQLCPTTIKHKIA